MNNFWNNSLILLPPWCSTRLVSLRILDDIANANGKKNLGINNFMGEYFLVRNGKLQERPILKSANP